MATISDKRAAQEYRQSIFPEDRIAFMQNKADLDRNCFKKWEKSRRTIHDMVKLCKEIAENNFLDGYFPEGMIPITTMQNELKIIGWPYEIKKEVIR